MCVREGEAGAFHAADSGAAPAGVKTSGTADAAGGSA